MTEKTPTFDDLFNLNRSYKGINVSGGNPAWDPPDFVKKAAMDVLFSYDISRYTSPSGEDVYKKETLGFFERLGANTSKRGTSNVIMSMGVTQLWCNYVALIKEKAKKTDDGKTPVILMSNLTYGLCAQVAKDAGVKVVGIPISEKNGFKIMPEDLEDTIKAVEKDGTHKVMCLKIDNPHNPTGAIMDKDDIQKLADVLVKKPYKKIDIFDDLVYAGLEYGDKKPFPFAGISHPKDPEFRDRVFTATSLSKAAAMPGIRAGVGFGKKEDISFFTMKTNEQISNVPLTSQAAIAAYLSDEHADERKAFEDKSKQDYTFRRKLTEAMIVGENTVKFTPAEEKELEETFKKIEPQELVPEIKEIMKTGIKGVRVTNPDPEAGFFHLLSFDISDRIPEGKSSIALSQSLIKEGRFFPLPGELFTEKCPRDESNPEREKRLDDLEKEQKLMIRTTFAFGKAEIVCMSLLGLNRAMNSIRERESKQLMTDRALLTTKQNNH